MLKLTMSFALLLLIGATTAVLTAALSVSHNETTSSATTAAREAPATDAITAVQETPAPDAATVAVKETSRPAGMTVVNQTPAPTTAEVSPAPASATTAGQGLPSHATTMMAVEKASAPADATITVQETPAPVNAANIKSPVTPEPEEAQRIATPTAIASNPAPAEMPTAKRLVRARQHSTAIRVRTSRATARVGPYPGYATGLFSLPDFFGLEYRRQNGVRGVVANPWLR